MLIILFSKNTDNSNIIYFWLLTEMKYIGNIDQSESRQSISSVDTEHELSI